MKDIADAAQPYRIPDIVADGQNVILCREDDRRPGRAGEGPTPKPRRIAICKSLGRPAPRPAILEPGYYPLAISSFRLEREMRAWMQHDPVVIARNILTD